MRHISAEIKKNLREDKKMALITGPRQVGKTTLAKHLLKEAAQEGNYFNWDIESHRKQIIREPESFWMNTGAPRRPKEIPRIVLDEIHKYPRWKRFLKGLYDANSGKAEIVVTGSGRLDVYQRGGDSLFGRYWLYHLYPFTAGELIAGKPPPGPRDFWGVLYESGPPAGAEEALSAVEKFTGFPEPLFAASETRLNKWRATRNHLVIREDLRDLTRIREIGLIESLVALLPERIGSPLSLNSLARDLGVAFHTAQAWVNTLARLYYLFMAKPYSGKLARAIRKEGKAYLFDPTEIREAGAKFENTAALHLNKLCGLWTDMGYGSYELRYVRDREKRETDFLITEGGRPYALIEAKLSETAVHPGLRYFRQRLNPEHTIQVVRRASRIRREPGLAVIPAAKMFALI